MKNGFLTSEFWITLLTEAVAIVATIHPGFKIPDATITTAGSLLAGAAVAIHYAWSRTSLKKVVASKSVG